MENVDVKRGYRFRFYPNDAQAKQLAQTFGCVRFVYNHMLHLRSEAWKERKESINYNATSARLTLLKTDEKYTWLNDVSSVVLQQALRHLQKSFENFFEKRAGYPKFKSKYNDQSASYASNAFTLQGQRLVLGRMKHPLNIKWSRTLPKSAIPSSVTVSKDASGRYFVSLLCDDVVCKKPKLTKEIGIDLGLTCFAAVSDGEKIPPKNALRQREKQLVSLQRKLAKKKKGSKNRAKAKHKVAKKHAQVADSRKDFLHKLSKRLIHENQVICMESLAVKNMLKNHCLAKSISDAGWSEFVRQIEYKAAWYGRTFVQIDQWYASSKRCSGCGHVLDELPLHIREWTCPKCKAHHDRDINAAKNILAAGSAVIACGDTVRPKSPSRRRRRDSAKQETQGAILGFSSPLGD